jgi:hypothetical protein
MSECSFLLTAAGQSRTCTGFPCWRSLPEAPPEAMHNIRCRSARVNLNVVVFLTEAKHMCFQRDLARERRQDDSARGANPSYLFGYPVKMKSLLAAMPWHVAPHFASLPCGGRSVALTGEKVLDASS